MVLVDHPVESSSASYGLVHGDDDGWAVVGWPAWLVRVGAVASYQPSVPGEQRRRCDDPVCPHPGRQQAGEGGRDRPVRLGQSWSAGVLPAEHATSCRSARTSTSNALSPWINNPSPLNRLIIPRYSNSFPGTATARSYQRSSVRTENSQLTACPTSYGTAQGALGYDEGADL